ncbi:MAG: hypothetical protein ABIH83_00125 [Candidatus Micrarchaeota archaeon]
MTDEIENSFQVICKVLLGNKLSNLHSYSKWLWKNIREPVLSKSAVSKKTVYSPPLVFSPIITPTAVKLEESFELGKTALNRDEVQKLTIKDANRQIIKIKYHNPEFNIGKNIEIYECGSSANSSFCTHGYSFVNSKFCAYCFWARDSECIFGSDFVFSSKFCLKCYSSLSLSRCFEVSSSTNCSDCYFCHNCDACTECLFCTNAKSLHYAIFNRQYPKEEYLKIKKLVLAEIASKLEKEKKFDLSIFNIGCKTK